MSKLLLYFYGTSIVATGRHMEVHEDSSVRNLGQQENVGSIKHSDTRMVGNKFSLLRMLILKEGERISATS